MTAASGNRNDLQLGETGLAPGRTVVGMASIDDWREDEEDWWKDNPVVRVTYYPITLEVEGLSLPMAAAPRAAW